MGRSQAGEKEPEVESHAHPLSPPLPPPRPRLPQAASGREARLRREEGAPVGSSRACAGTAGQRAGADPGLVDQLVKADSEWRRCKYRDGRVTPVLPIPENSRGSGVVPTFSSTRALRAACVRTRIGAVKSSCPTVVGSGPLS
ncbi:hypothetical protein P7K49_016393 [Saguinus oedipus]|uniref:Uncharacterized protein n=1 Tax=Saguinus oedipus TaxID=9490 RepID=A0ABQ9VBY5_SAGOE|nr:hypothetical protein P7K49_016393 [Saguinus oedipus]